ncbi:DUF998 domain-containing protein [Actinoplanes regularis]|uniref:Hypothetical membrane protein n=1 Tax=Actinoplanes regularis TaxID=52697 RepID=A0A239BQU6_9ACTN|nr:DUF998 domain-containing protein [Actinoplanes regularis]GIE88340.1 hypothetical protein Are01nite_48200 [Actinoplanes regularis]SNS10226.1 hypothetical membrane protein [Actinoplanes regularis]
MNPSRLARIGASCWILAAPLFLAANVLTALRWHNPAFSWATHNISDLGNVHCGIWDTTRPRNVCSPWHPLMNTAILATAALLAAGLVLTWRALGHGVVVRLAQSLLLLAVLGYALAGAYPADVDENLHVLGAVLILVVGNLGLPIAGLAPRTTTLGRYRVLTLSAGLIALAGSVLFFAQQGLGLGVGAMERVAAFPFSVWASCVGVALLAGARTPGPARP